MRIVFLIVSVLATILTGASQTPYSHPIIAVQSGNYITNLANATNADTNIVRSSTTLGGTYLGQKNGTPSAHIVIINEGGVVNMTGGMEIENCSYIDIIGWGSADAFGFQFLNGNSSGNPVHIVGKCSNITIKGYKLIGGFNGGVWIKTEVSEVSSRYACDLSFLTTPMLNITFSCNWLQDCGGEAVYIGSTGWKADRPMNCSGVITYPKPQEVGYIHCDSNIIINSGRTGAQMSGSISNTNNFGTMIGNKVYYAGRGLESNQGVGLFVGGGFRNATVQNNYVHGTYHWNYAVQGYGNTIFENNYGDSSTWWKTVHNTEPLSPVFIATSVNPTTWKIRNNTMIGGTAITNGHPTQYAIYSDNKNTDTGNVICNNVGTVDVFGPLIYSNTCAILNLPPVVNAGPNATRTLPTNTYQLNGSASDPDGIVTAVQWALVSGPTYTISNANILNPTLTNLVAGVYRFSLTAVDNSEASASDTMQLTINPAPVNNAPVANAGSDITIQLPTSSTTLTGSATDDGTIASAIWSQVSGTAATITTASSLITTITGLTTAGTRTFRLIVTDNLGLKDTDDVNVNVLPAPNVPPVVNAGTDQTITQPATTINLSGTATDADGSISSTLWTNADGCSITSATSLTTTATCTILGAHVFTLTGTDNQGATTQDIKIGTVLAAVNVAPVAIAAANQTVYLPLDSLVLTQSGTDADGFIANQLSYIIQTSYAATLSRPGTLTPALKGLTEGDTIKVVLRVTDDDSSYGYDTTTIIVLDTTNLPPVAQINRPLTATLNMPVGSVVVSGAASYDLDDFDYISSYLWEQVSGSAVTITNSAGQVVTLDGFTIGVYSFRLTVTDSRGATDSIEFTITVEDALRFKQNKAITRQ